MNLIEINRMNRVDRVYKVMNNSYYHYCSILLSK